MPDFLDRLGQELVRVASTPLPAQPSTTAAPSEPRAVDVAPERRRRRPRWLPAIVALLIVGAAAAAIATLGRRSPGPVPPRPSAPLASAPDATDRAAFALLRRPLQTADAIPPQTPLALSGASGANLDLARRVQRPASERAWAIPGRGSLCLFAAWPIANASGAACAKDSDALSGKLIVAVGVLSAPDRTFVAGLVPDGVRSVTVSFRRGARRRLAVIDNVYQATLASDATELRVSAGGRSALLTLTQPTHLRGPRH